MELPRNPAEVRDCLERTMNDGIKNSIRNCLTVFQLDELLYKSICYNILTDRIDIVKPLWWKKSSSSMTDTDFNYLLLYLEENYGLTSEKKIQKAISIIADKNKYHPIRDYLKSLVWDGTERISEVLHYFFGTEKYQAAMGRGNGNLSKWKVSVGIYMGDGAVS